MPDPIIDLFEVGPRKPMGYLPLATLEKYGHSPENVAKQLTDMGLKVLHREQIHDDMNLETYGKMVVYDEQALRKFLEEHAEALRKRSWPVDPRRYALHVVNNNVKSTADPELYRIIGLGFADRRMVHPGKYKTAGSSLRPDDELEY